MFLKVLHQPAPAASAKGGVGAATQARTGTGAASGQAPTACAQLARACGSMVSDCLRAVPHECLNRLIVIKSLIATLSIMLSYSMPAQVLMHRYGHYPQAITSDLWISSHLFVLPCG